MGLFDLFKKKKENSSEALEKAKKYNLGLKKTRSGFLSKLKNVLAGYDEVTEDLFDDLTDVFIMADIGVETTLDCIEELKEGGQSCWKRRFHGSSPVPQADCAL